MADSLILAGLVELLGGGVPSDHPLCPGAIFRLAKGFDFSAPATDPGTVMNLIMGGSASVGRRYANRRPKLPIFIQVPRTGDDAADRATLAGAREVLLLATSAPWWDMTWVRDGGKPFILTCLPAEQAVVAWSITGDKQLQSNLELTFEALPFGRSDAPEALDFNPASVSWPTPPAPVTIDSFGASPPNFLTGQDASFDGGIGSWTGATGWNCGVAAVTTPVHGGTGAMRMTATADGDMIAIAEADTPAGRMLGMPVVPGQAVFVGIWNRAGTTGRYTWGGVLWADAAGAALSWSWAGLAGDNSSGWVNSTGLVFAPAGAAYAVAADLIMGAVAGEQHFVDDAWLAPASVWSADDGESWSQTSAARVEGSYSARWSRHAHDMPTYDHDLVTPVDITGRTKLSLWVGLGTSTYSTWHCGNVTVRITLRDGADHTVTVTITSRMDASGRSTIPHWQRVSGPIPPLEGVAFDPTTVSGYVVEAWSHVEGGGVRALLADCYLDSLTATAATAGATGPRGTVYRLPGMVGTAPFPLSLQLQPGPNVAPTVTEWTTAGDHSWQAPAGVTSVQAEPTGAGGGGKGAMVHGGPGGGGGEWAMQPDIPVTPLSNYTGHVGAGGVHSDGLAQYPWAAKAGDGEDSYFTGDGGAQVRAHGGEGGGHDGSYEGGDGGHGSTAFLHFNGGKGGGQDFIPAGGGGGGSAGPSGPGADHPYNGSSQYVPGPAQNGGSVGGYGGHYGNGSSPASGAGGGGGGGGNPDGSTGGANDGANGKPGKLRLVYSSTVGSPLTTAILHHPPQDAPSSLAPLIPIGGGADAPGATYTAPMTGQLQARYRGTYRFLVTAYSWNTPANARTLTLTITQVRPGGTNKTTVLTRTITPNTDVDPCGTPIVTSKIVDMGFVTLPIGGLPAGQNSDYFTVTPGDNNGSDRLNDVLLLDTSGETVIWSTAGAGMANLWADEPEPGTGLGMFLGSAGDRDQAVSLLDQCELWGGPLRGAPGEQKFLAYSVQGTPTLTGKATPRWWLDRLL